MRDKSDPTGGDHGSVATNSAPRRDHRLAVVLLYGVVCFAPAATLVALGVASFRVYSDLVSHGRSEAAMDCATGLGYAVVVSLACGYALALRFVLDVRRAHAFGASQRVAWTFFLLFVPVLGLPAYWWHWARRQR